MGDMEGKGMWNPEKEGQEGDQEKGDQKFWLGELQNLTPFP